MTITSPADGRLLAKVPLATIDDVNRAVDAAKTAFPSWSATPLVERMACIRHLIDVLGKHAVDLGVLDAIDCANPVTAMIGDIGMAARWLEYQAGVAFEVKGETIPSMGRNWIITRREPYGVVGRIIPFNHPVLFAAGKIGAPILMGNTFVLKGSSLTALRAARARSWLNLGEIPLGLV
jgi:acyl-CoA reductase-like NAD-dependent aldehyde dehydrogenase